MPTVANANLRLTESGGQVTINVTYDVTFSAYEKQLARLGMDYHSHVTTHGIDGSTVGPSIPEAEFVHEKIDVTVGGDDPVRMEQQKIVGRVFLQEDSGANTDELKCNIRIHSVHPPLFTDDFLTDEESMLG